MANFNWETEEEHGSWEESQAPEVITPRRRRWFVWLFAAVLVLLLIGSGVIIVRQVDRRVAEAVKNTETAVLTSHELIIDAALITDRELFTNLLSGRDLNWTRGEVRLMENRLLFNRPHLGLQTSNIRAQRPQISLNPDLTQAVLTRTISYEQISDGREVQLQQVGVYRQGAERWLLSPLNLANDDWSFNNHYEGRFVSTSYPIPDAELAGQISRDLDNTIRAVCAGFFDVSCPPRLHYDINFTTDPNTLMEISLASQRGFDIGEEPAAFKVFNLPTPTLVGLPVDEEGYHILFKGYAHVVAQDIMNSSLQTYWASLPDLRSYSLNHHLYQLGLDLTVPLTNTTSMLQTNFTQDIMALCMYDEGAALTNYDPLTDELTPVLPERVFTNMEASPNDTLLALEELFVNGSNSASLVAVWAPGREDTFVAANFPRDSIKNLEWREHPTQPRLVIDQQLDTAAMVFHTITLDEPCLNGNCVLGTEFNPTDEQIYWSESGNQTLINMSDGALFLGDASGRPQTFIGAGFRPFWVNDMTYSYLTNSNAATGSELYIGQVNPFALGRTLGIEELRQALPPDYQSAGLFVPFAAANPGDEQQIVILALSQDQLGNIGTAFILLYNRQTREITIPIQSDQMYSFSLSPDGVYLQATIYDLLQQQQTIQLYNLQTGVYQTIPLPGITQGMEVDWSEDNQWMMFLAEGYLHLINAESGEHVVRLPGKTAGCFQVTWMNKEE